jgi:hypothetical protein
MLLWMVRYLAAAEQQMVAYASACVVDVYVCLGWLSQHVVPVCLAFVHDYIFM